MSFQASSWWSTTASSWIRLPRGSWRMATRANYVMSQKSRSCTTSSRDHRQARLQLKEGEHGCREKLRASWPLPGSGADCCPGDGATFHSTAAEPRRDQACHLHHREREWLGRVEPSSIPRRVGGPRRGGTGGP